MVAIFCTNPVIAIDETTILEVKAIITLSFQLMLIVR